MKYLFLVLMLLSDVAMALSISIIVNDSVNIDNIGNLTISDIYLEKVHNFNNKYIIPLNNKSLENSFYYKVIGKDKYEMKEFWSSKLFTSHGYPPLSLNSDKIIINLIKINSGMIGYVRSSNLAGVSGVRVVYVLNIDEQDLNYLNNSSIIRIAGVF